MQINKVYKKKCFCCISCKKATGSYSLQQNIRIKQNIISFSGSNTFFSKKSFFHPVFSVEFH